MKADFLKKRIAAAAVGALCGLALPSHASVIGIDLAGEYTQANSDAWALGYEFSLSGTTQLDGLGFWDIGDGYNTTTVGLWTADGTLLGKVDTATSTVTSFATGSIGTWNFMDISLTLGAGNYVVGSWGSGMEYAYQRPTGTVTTNILSFVATREQSGGTFQYPTNAYCPDCEGFFGGNVRFADDTAAVPEPGTMSLIGLTLVGFAAARRKRQAVVS